MSVRFDQVSVSFGRRAALNRVSASLMAGSVTGIVGPNGAGKTTLLRAALGLQPLSHGHVDVLGKALADWPREALARAMAYLPQGGEARWPMPVEDVVLLGRLPYRGFGPPDLKDRLAAADALARCEAPHFARRRMDELSAGERARVLFARALATGAAVLFADEPAAYLDPSHQLRLMDLLREEARRGTAVAVTLHDLSLAARHCDRVLVLEQGALAADGPPAEAFADATLARVFKIAREPDSLQLGAFRRL
ncbi:ABC transporter ATP-binding protein [Rhizomicrobium electricum]|uniref:ABC transporter ATP-binding protein n=1 Tax=Rhizomicrobium electricum TaxID=480070 RepID=A0ABP3P915_9PROT|nr:ABC transporter ATP-binding protein [Rhizomicrobium electricum]NIJ48090.1 iron complex transport system ATP-binding protein [Rhizomicrobium electricum]